MSTVPDDAWRDAGLDSLEDTTSLEDATSLVEEVERPDPRPHREETEEYRPRTARPDLEGKAAEADVVEQSQIVPETDEQPGDPDQL
jgi:hypothetical protein